MRLDHLLSREYKEGIKTLLVPLGSSKSLRVKYYIVLKVRKHFQKGTRRKPIHRGGVAQLGEHLLCKQGVIGSNPFISTRSIERVERE